CDGRAQPVEDGRKRPYDRPPASLGDPPKTWMPGTRPGMTKNGSLPPERAYFFPSPPNFFWKRERRPPRSSRCCCPPVHAGCDFGSMSRRSVSPGLPQVVRVVNSVPSVMTTL